MTLNSKIAQLPAEQASWLVLIKGIFKNSIDFDRKGKKELIDAVEIRAMERGYNEISSLLNTNDLEEYFKNEQN